MLSLACVLPRDGSRILSPFYSSAKINKVVSCLLAAPSKSKIMLSARLCQAAWSACPRSYGQSLPVLKTSFTFRVNGVKSNPLTKNHDVRFFVDNSRGRVSHAARRRTLSEAAMQPAGDTAFSIGRGAVAGGAVVGIGALCYYGLGLSSEAGTIEKSVLWPQYVKDRIKSTYMYFGGSIAISVASAAAVFSNPRLLEVVSRGGILPMVVTLGLLIGSDLIVRSMPYSPGLGMKQLAWMGHSALIGAVLAPMAFLGGPILLKAGWYTAGIVGGLSAVAMCAPSDKFLQMGGPLAIGLGIVFASSIGSMFLPPTTALGSGLYSITLYGGLLLFSGFLLYNTQRIVYQAEKYPPDNSAPRPFDPINMSISIYLDAVNIFIRIATILAGGGGGNKRR